MQEGSFGLCSPLAHEQPPSVTLHRSSEPDPLVPEPPVVLEHATVAISAKPNAAEIRAFIACGSSSRRARRESSSTPRMRERGASP